MKLQRYLTEEKGILDVIEMLEQNCQPFIRDFIATGQPHRFLYRGDKAVFDYKKKPIRQNRKPVDTSNKMHDELNKRFKKRFGIELRSKALFATPDNIQALEYGNLYMVFPVSEYKIYWSPKITDLYVELGGTDVVFNISGGRKTSYDIRTLFDDHASVYFATKKEEKDANSAASKALDTLLRSYKKGDLSGLVRSSNECMIVCKEIILVSAKYRTDLGDYFRDYHMYKENPDELKDDFKE